MAFRERQKKMKNAHLRFGKMSFTKTVGKSLTSFSLCMDRFVGERVSRESPRAHFLSVFGGDAQIAGVSAIISENESFTVEGPGIEPLNVNMGKDAQCFRASIQLSTSKRPLRHLVAVSQEFGAPANSETNRRTLLAASSADYVWASIAQIFGLPAVPEWANWFYHKLDDNFAIQQIYGLGCRPVLITGSKEEFLRWLSDGVRKRDIQLPERNGPAVWPSTALASLLLPPADTPADLDPGAE
jgi:hypothetical protein